MKLVLTGGGTGGHIFPALSVLEALRTRDDLRLDVRFYGPDNRGERVLVEGAGLRLERVPAAAIRDRGPVALAKSMLRLGWGTLVAAAKLARFRPAAVFSTGGYASFPTSLAGRLTFRPVVVYLPDVAPGWAVRAEMRLATRLATTAEAALDHLPRGKTVVTGYPVRPEFFSQSGAEARAALGLEAGTPVLLVAGASQGSTAINDAVFAALPQLLEQATVIHVTGQADISRAEVLRSSLGVQTDRYRPAAFRGDLPTVMRAADLAVMRAGASVLGELPAAGLPAILIPGTYAGGHQRDNARWLEAAGAVSLLEENDIASLPGRALALIGDPPRLAAMRRAAEGLARPNAASDIANLVLEVAKR